MTEEEKKSLEAFIELQLGKAATGLPAAQKANILKGKFKRIYLFLALNIGMLIFFGYSFYYDITRLSQTVFYLIVVFFVLNVFFFINQWKKLKRAVDYLETIER